MYVCVHGNFTSGVHCLYHSFHELRNANFGQNKIVWVCVCVGREGGVHACLCIHTHTEACMHACTQT